MGYTFTTKRKRSRYINMHIAIDISPLESGHNGRGVGVYTKLLIEAIQTYQKEHVVSLVTHQHDIPDTCNIVHYPYFDPFFLTLPLIRKYPTVVTVHDVIPLLYPDKFPAGIKGSIKFQIQKFSLSSVKRIITDSNTSKEDIKKVFNRDPKSIDVVYLASSIREHGSTTIGSSQKELKSSPYIMYVGDVNWNKNILGLLTAFANIIKTHPTLQLLLVGKSFCDESLVEVQEIKQQINSLNLESHIQMPGFVDTKTLVELYKNAICLIQPSFYEGFGFSVVDALSLGCPVVCSRVSSLSEISGPSMQIDPNVPETMTERVLELLQMSDMKRKKMIQDGYDWVLQFTWEKVAKETIESYKKAIV